MMGVTPSLIDARLEKEKAYWLGRLTGELPVSGVPLDNERPPVWTGRKGSATSRIDADTARRLMGLCAHEDSLIFTVLVAALQICLHKYTGCEDLIVGTTIHEKHAATAALNRVLALRLHIDPSASVRQLLLEAKRMVAEAYAHQKFPFPRILQLLNVEARPDREALFNTVILLSNVNNLENVSHLKNDITLVCARRGDSLTLTIFYNDSLFKRGSILVFGRHYRRLLRNMLADLDRPVAQLALLSADKQQALCRRFNQTQCEYPKHKTVHQLFEEQVERTPTRIAAVHRGGRLTYRELNLRADRLARHLRRLGAGPGTHICVLLPRSMGTLIALFAVLKTGAAYVALDPAHPPHRSAFVINDSQSQFVLTHRRLADGLPPHGARVVCLDEAGAAVETEGREDMTGSAVPQDLAYVIYTSGSTGQPKGVKIQHRALVNYVWWAREVYLRGEQLSFPLYSSLAFDLTVTSIFVPLVTGGRVLVYDSEESSAALEEVVTDNQVEVLKLTPSHLALLAERDNRGSRIKRLIVGGEALSTALARRILHSFGGGVEIFNEYGPTEATVGCTLYRFDATRADRAFVPIGRPAANTQVYVLDEQLNPVAENVVGELYIAGDGLAAGYLNRPELTNAKFIANPFRQGEKMYRSGDRGRWLPEGELDFVGRGDEQVKFHGYRVELNEIRSAINRHPQIRDSVVTVGRDEGGNQVMVAYYAARRELASGELRQFLATSVIAETLPNFFVHLRRLPLTLNGKVNHAALPPARVVREQGGRGLAETLTPVEEVLAGIWAEVLRLERVGRHDNFFELGGHSLLGAQVVSRVREAFGVPVPLRSLFDSPTVASLGEQVGRLLGTRLPSAGLPIKRLPQADSYPLSFAQSRMWFLSRVEPSSPFYNIPAVVRLEGQLNTEALTRALNEVINRHDSLRTNFKLDGGKPAQFIAPARERHWPVIDLSALPDKERAAEAQRLAQEEALRPFDLTRDSLFRLSLLRLTEREHMALVTMHHIVSDAWSTDVLLREVATLYEAYLQGRHSPLKALPLRYVDYAAWERERLQGSALTELLAYWRGQLGGELTALRLPTDKPATAHSFRGARYYFELSAETSRALKTLCRQHGVTLYMASLAAFQVLLHRYTGQEDIVVVSPVAGRGRAETEGLIGCFVNTLVLRTHLGGDPSFAELLHRVREVALAAYAHQDMPFDRLVTELQPERRQSHMPLFQVMFAVQHAPPAEYRMPGLTLRLERVTRRTAQFPIMLVLEEAAQGLGGMLEYNTDLFDARTIERMLGHFQELLGGLTARPHEPISAPPLLTRAERRRMLFEWNETASGQPPDTSVHRLFEEQARRRPHAPALVSSREQLSYLELDGRANALARHLRAQGVRAELPVAILLERSTEMVVAALGILKAGGAYLPLDPEWPPERLAHVLEDAGLRLLLTRRGLADRARARGLRTIYLDADLSEADDVREQEQAGESSPENLAYVICTSGSTGRPKAVAVEHRALSNLVQWHRRYFEVGPADRATLIAGVAFDAAVWELWPYLCAGASLYLPDDELRSAPERLRDWLVAHDISICFMPTPLAEKALAVAWPADAPLRTLLTGGDRLRRHPDAALGFRLVNNYGPTECAVVTTSGIVSPDEEAVGLPPLGRPIDNAQVYLLDARLEPVPAGLTGELYIGGRGLARGYLNNPRLTAERFVPHPYAKRPGARLYRTGDLARYLHDGRLEFLGRSDQQVKIRGFRVELGEVEAAITEHPAVRAAVVIAKEGGLGERHLLGYVAAGPAAPTARELREFLKLKLPEYMIPTDFLLLDQLPLTADGSKVDRRALPSPDTVSAQPGAASSPLERQIAGIWQEALGLEHVGLDDNFFDMGGHSLLLVEVVSKMTEAFGREVSVVEVFEHPTVSALARHLGGASTQKPSAPHALQRAEARRAAARRAQQRGERR
ncbi:MAG: amino acid adenylation domain-containing protein [Acidobacteria bacterium]|nr:amino acid adenylation domain-containing protein [Acidobacteriota bacterium]